MFGGQKSWGDGTVFFLWHTRESQSGYARENTSRDKLLHPFFYYIHNSEKY